MRAGGCECDEGRAQRSAVGGREDVVGEGAGFVEDGLEG